MQKENGLFLGLVVSALLMLTSCTLFEQQESKPVFVIVNVLDKEFYDDCHIKGSINVPFEHLETYALNHWDKNTTEIIVHCTNYKCTASGAAWQALHDLGFKKVFAYEGGTAEAMHAGVAVEGPCKETYLQDYVKSAASADHRAGEAAVAIISVEELKKKLEEFAVNS